MKQKILFAIVIITVLFSSVAPAFAAAEAGADLAQWIVEDKNSRWTVAELAALDQILSETLEALEAAGIDGEATMSGYRFRRSAGEYVEGTEGLVALVRHHEQTIYLSDAAFLRLDGFYIYHELGHVVDKRLGRELSARFHGQIGSKDVTADGYWLREHAHEDREEATADAFALWVAVQRNGNRPPVFPGQPLSADIDTIAGTLARALAKV